MTDTPPAKLPIILLPGMGADERLFEQQLKVFPSLRVPRWIAPLKHETLAAYAARFAKEINPGGPCIIGGASFGGFVAMEMLPFLDARMCLLISSARSPAEFPPLVRLAAKGASLARVVPFEACVAAAGHPLVLACFRSPATKRFLRQLGSTQGEFLRWASEATLNWRPTVPPSSIPIRHIHGGRDHVLPIRYVRADDTIPRGGHVISMTHGDAVNSFIERCVTSSLPTAAPLPGNPYRRARTG